MRWHVPADSPTATIQLDHPAYICSDESCELRHVWDEEDVVQIVADQVAGWKRALTPGPQADKGDGWYDQIALQGVGFYQSTDLCARCGCMVPSFLVDKHDEWHEWHRTAHTPGQPAEEWLAAVQRVRDFLTYWDALDEGQLPAGRSQRDWIAWDYDSGVRTDGHLEPATLLTVSDLRKLIGDSPPTTSPSQDAKPSIIGRDQFIVETIARIALTAVHKHHAVTSLRNLPRGYDFTVEAEVDGKPSGHIIRFVVTLDRFEQSSDA